MNRNPIHLPAARSCGKAFYGFDMAGEDVLSVFVNWGGGPGAAALLPCRPDLYPVEIMEKT